MPEFDMIIVNHNAHLWQSVRICASALSLLFCVQAVASFYQRWILIELCKAHKELGCRLSFERYDINSLCFFLAGASCLVLLTLPSQSLASLYNKFGAVWLSFLSNVYRVRFIPYLPQHQPESNTHRPIPARDGCVVVAIARNCGSTTTSNVFCRNIDNSGNGEGKPFQLQKLENRSFWTNEEVNNEELKVGCLLEYRGRTCQNLLGRLCELGNRDGGQFIFVRNIGKKPQNVDKLLLDFQDDESVYRGLKEAHGYVNLKAHRFQGILEKLYTKLHIARTRIYFIGIRAFTIENERITLETMDKERLCMPLNCRENLVSSTAPVHMQLDRLRKVADDDGDDGGDHDVPGVAVVKFEACEFTCEGLISRYKPFIISRDEEPVEIQNACGKVIPVPGHCRVLFDTGNEVATSISRELLLELNLQPVLNKKVKVKLSGRGSGQFEKVEIKLIIRGYPFKVWALVDAAAEGTDLLVGMDIIQKLFDSGYTIGD